MRLDRLGRENDGCCSTTGPMESIRKLAHTYCTSMHAQARTSIIYYAGRQSGWALPACLTLSFHSLDAIQHEAASGPVHVLGLRASMRIRVLQSAASVPEKKSRLQITSDHGTHSYSTHSTCTVHYIALHTRTHSVQACIVCMYYHHHFGVNGSRTVESLRDVHMQCD